MLGYWKRNGSYYSGLGFRDMLGLYWGYIGILAKKMEATLQGLGLRVKGLGGSQLSFHTRIWGPGRDPVGLNPQP